MEVVCLLKKILYFVYARVPCLYDVIDKSFPKDRLDAALSECFFFNFGHEDVSKGYGHFRAHGCSMGLEIIFPVKLKRVFL